MKTDGMTLKWCLPLAALLPFTALGIGQVVRSAPVRRLEGTLPAPGDPHFRDAVQSILGTPLQRGSKIELLQNGDGLFPRMWRDIEAAR